MNSLTVRVGSSTLLRTVVTSPTVRVDSFTLLRTVVTSLIVKSGIWRGIETIMSPHASMAELLVSWSWNWRGLQHWPFGLQASCSRENEGLMTVQLYMGSGSCLNLVPTTW